MIDESPNRSRVLGQVSLAWGVLFLVHVLSLFYLDLFSLILKLALIMAILPVVLFMLRERPDRAGLIRGVLWLAIAVQGLFLVGGLLRTI